MSWSAKFDFTDGNVVEQSVVEINIEPDYHNDQYEEALNAVWGLIDSGTLGSVEGSYSVNITGHGNENHQPAEGWSNDFVTITVAQR